MARHKPQDDWHHTDPHNPHNFYYVNKREADGSFGIDNHLRIRSRAQAQKLKREGGDNIEVRAANAPEHVATDDDPYPGATSGKYAFRN